MNPLFIFTYQPGTAFVLLCTGMFALGGIFGFVLSWLFRAIHFRRSLNPEVRERLASLAVQLASEQRARESAETETARVRAMVLSAIAMNGKVVEILTGASATTGNQDDANSKLVPAPRLHTANT